MEAGTRALNKELAASSIVMVQLRGEGELPLGACVAIVLYIVAFDRPESEAYGVRKAILFLAKPECGWLIPDDPSCVDACAASLPRPGNLTMPRPTSSGAEA